MAVPFSITLRDAKNQTSTMHFYSPAESEASFLADVAAVAAAVDAASNCSVTSRTGGNAGPIVSGAAGGNWADVEDKGVVVIVTAAGSIHRYQVPAPVDGFFLADGETMDGGGPGQAVGVAIIAHCVTRDDAVFLGPPVGGYRARVKTQRKFNIFTRSTSLAGQGL